MTRDFYVESFLGVSAHIEINRRERGEQLFSFARSQSAFEFTICGVSGVIAHAKQRQRRTASDLENEHNARALNRRSTAA